MTYPTIPTVAAGRVLSVLATSPSGTHTSPNLSSLTKNAGDTLLAIVIIYDGNSTNAEFSAWGGGFTELPVGGDNAGTATMGIGVAYKTSTGAEAGTFTVTSADTSTNDSAFFLLSIPAANTSTAPEAGSFVTGTTSAADPGSFDPSWGIEETLWIAVGGSGETGTGGNYDGISAAPANYNNYAESGISADVVGGVEGAVAFRQLEAQSEDVGTFTLDVSNARNAALVIAVRSPTIAGSFTGNAVVRAEQAGSFSADAVIKAERSASFATDAIASATQSATFTGNAILRATAVASFTADAVQLKTTTAGLSADAVILMGRLDGYTADAALLSPQASSFSADAFISTVPAFSFTANAIIKAEQVLAYTGSAVLERGQTDTFTADAVLFAVRLASFTADAVTSTFVVHADDFTANAWIRSPHFDYIRVTLTAATISATMSMEATVVSASFTADAVIA